MWHDPLQITPSPDLAAAVKGHPLIADILARRGIATPAAALAFLNPNFYPPTPADELPDLCIAADHLEQSIIKHIPILIWGDFDVDGQTSTALLIDSLSRLAAEVAFYIPDRARESHGIRVDSLREQIARFQPGILLTCDTGISAHESIDYAKACSLITLVTDHHDLPPTLPTADAVVNPKRLPPDHPLASLPGVGVAYKLIELLYTRLGRQGELSDFLDLVALGIVADVARQTYDTRYLLQIGLEQLRQTRRVGLQALLEVAGLEAGNLSATDIAFQIGPRLNAAGRLGDTKTAVELLTTTNPSKAHLLAVQLEGLNRERRLQDRQIYAAAQEQIARDPTLLDWTALVLAQPAWHPGLIGIVASQLAEYYQRPVVLFSTSDDGLARGSARTAPGYDIGAAIAAQADLLLTYGGHPGAAGVSLPIDNIPAFRRRLSNTLQAQYNPAARPGLAIDAWLPLEAITLDLANELERLAPFGEGNPRVMLATRELRLRSATYLDRAHQHRRLVVEDGAEHRQNVIWWNGADQPLPDTLFDLAYELEIRVQEGMPELQLVLKDWRVSPSAPVTITRTRPEIVDLRQVPDPVDTLQRVLADYPGAVVWAEGYRRAESPGVPLDELTESSTLVIFSPPAMPHALQDALQRVKPGTIVLIAADPPIGTFADVQRRLLELIKYVINRQAGRTTLQALAAATAQTHQTICLGLDWCAAAGEIIVTYQPRGAVELRLGNGTPSGSQDEALRAFQASFQETAAYRAFFRRAAPHHLFGWDEPI